MSMRNTVQRPVEDDEEVEEQREQQEQEDDGEPPVRRVFLVSCPVPDGALRFALVPYQQCGCSIAVLVLVAFSWDFETEVEAVLIRSVSSEICV